MRSSAQSKASTAVTKLEQKVAALDAAMKSRLGNAAKAHTVDEFDQLSACGQRTAHCRDIAYAEQFFAP
eukprot:3599785-Pleurochrysis_carterae.AAC.1